MTDPIQFQSAVSDRLLPWGLAVDSDVCVCEEIGPPE
jgi:hypothetical protein